MSLPYSLPTPFLLGAILPAILAANSLPTPAYSLPCLTPIPPIRSAPSLRVGASVQKHRRSGT